MCLSREILDFGVLGTRQFYWDLLHRYLCKLKILEWTDIDMLEQKFERRRRFVARSTEAMRKE
jgi:hypothetical protein